MVAAAVTGSRVLKVFENHRDGRDQTLCAVKIRSKADLKSLECEVSQLRHFLWKSCESIKVVTINLITS